MWRASSRSVASQRVGQRWCVALQDSDGRRQEFLGSRSHLQTPKAIHVAPDPAAGALHGLLSFNLVCYGVYCQRQFSLALQNTSRTSRRIQTRALGSDTIRVIAFFVLYHISLAFQVPFAITVRYERHVTLKTGCWEDLVRKSTVRNRDIGFGLVETSQGIYIVQCSENNYKKLKTKGK
jgi:hypothetical protein